MPSKHTVVVSLDAETEKIVKDLGGNRSQWIRDAIKWRHGPGGDLETMEALAEARKRQLNVAVRHMGHLAWCVRKLEGQTSHKSPLEQKTKDALEACEHWLEVR